MSKRILTLIVSLVFSLLLGGFASAEQTASPIQVEMEHIILSVSGDKVTALHILNAKNTSDKEFTGIKTAEGQEVFKADLPKGATDLKVMVEDPKTVVKSDTSFFTTTPIPANQSFTITYSYKLPQTGGHFVFHLKRPYNTQSLNVLVPNGEAKLDVQNKQMKDNGLMDFQGRNYQVYSTDLIKAGTQLDMILIPGKSSGAAAASGESQQSGNTVTRKAPDFHNPGHIRLWYQSPLKEFNPHILLVVLGTILISGISFYGYRKWKDQQHKKSVFSSDEEALFQQLLLTQKVILNKILELEEAYERAEITDDEYQDRRDAYKNRLMEVKLKLRDLA